MQPAVPRSLLSAAGAIGLMAACAQGSSLGDDELGTPDRVDPSTDAAISSSSGTPSSSGTASSSGSTSSGSTSSSGASTSSSSSGSTSSSGGTVSAACSAALAAIHLDFEGFDPTATGNVWYSQTLDGLQSDTSWPFNPWRISVAGTQVQPTACANGLCLGTELTQNYAQCQRGEAGSPIVDLSACAGASVALELDHAYAFSDLGSGFRDGGLVEMSGNAQFPNSATWTQVGADAMPSSVVIRGAAFGRSCKDQNAFYVNGKPGFTGTSAVTHTEHLAVPASALTSTARVRFLFSSGIAADTNDADASRVSEAFGWRIDNLRFVAQ